MNRQMFHLKIFLRTMAIKKDSLILIQSMIDVFEKMLD